MSNATKIKQLQGTTSGSILFIGAGGHVTEDNTGLFWDSANNRLGIGTSSPSEKLHVSGRARITTIDNGVGDFATISGTGVITRRTAAQTLTDIGGIANNFVTADLTFTANRTHELNGNTLYLGEGASSFPAITGGFLGISPTAAAISHTTSRYVQVTDTTIEFANGSNVTQITPNTVSFNINSDNIDFIISGDTDGGLFFTDASTDRVGIGTVLPSAKLHLNGSLRLQGLTTTPAAGYVLQSTDALGNADWVLPAGADGNGIYTGSGTVPNGTVATLTGTFRIDNATQQAVIFQTTNTIFNPNAANIDFIVRGDTDNNLMFVDASTDRVTIGTSSTNGKLGVVSTGGANPAIFAQCNAPIGTNTETIIATAAGLGAANSNTAIQATANGVTSGTNTGLRVLANNATGNNFAVSAGINGTINIGGVNDAVYTGFISNTSAATSNTYVAYLNNQSINSTTKFGCQIVLAGTQASGTGYGINIQASSIFTAGTSHGINVTNTGSTPTNYGARIFVQSTGTTNYGLHVSSTSATTNFGLVVDSGTSVFNESGGNFDFRVEGDTDINMIFGDASTDSVGIGTDVPSTKLDINGSFATRANSPAGIAANTNDYAIPNFSFIRISSTGAFNITGIANGVNGRRITLVNVGVNTITLTNQDALSVAANRLINRNGLSLSLISNAVAEFIYDATTARWRHTGGTA